MRCISDTHGTSTLKLIRVINYYKVTYKGLCSGFRKWDLFSDCINGVFFNDVEQLVIVKCEANR